MFAPVTRSSQFFNLLLCISCLLVNLDYALSESPAIFAWGSNQVGQFGSGTLSGESGFTNLTILGAKTLNSFSAGSAHAAFLDVDGKPYLWGVSTRTGVSSPPPRVSSPTLRDAYSFSQIICGQRGSYAIDKANGSVYYWGDAPEQFGEYFGQGAKPIPTIAPDIRFKRILALGAFHGAAINTTDHFVLWGKGIRGELGSGTSNSPTPIEFPFMPGAGTIDQVSLGYSHTVALFNLGNLYYAGSSDLLPELGFLEGQVSQIFPPGQDPIYSIASGSFHFLVLKGYSVYAYGLNNTGQLGISTGPIQHLVVIDTPAGVVPTQVGAVGNTSYALMSDGNVWSWGSSDFFKLLRRGESDSLAIMAEPGVTDLKSLIGARISKFLSPLGEDTENGITMFVRIDSTVPSLPAPQTVTCPLPEPVPVSEFECINGIWTKNGSISDTSITIGTPVTIQGNFTSSSTLTIINPTSSIINVTGCVVIDGNIVLVVNPDQDLSGRKLDLVLSSCITSNANLEVKTSKKSCKKYSATSETTSTSYSATFRVDSSKCRLWWIILASTLGGTLLLVAVISLISIKSGAFRRWIRPFSSRNTQKPA